MAQLAHGVGPICGRTIHAELGLQHTALPTYGQRQQTVTSYARQSLGPNLVFEIIKLRHKRTGEAAGGQAVEHGGEEGAGVWAKAERCRAAQRARAQRRRLRHQSLRRYLARAQLPNLRARMHRCFQSDVQQDGSSFSPPICTVSDKC